MIPCVCRYDGHASLWVWHLAWNVTNPYDVLKLPLQLNWKTAKKKKSYLDRWLPTGWLFENAQGCSYCSWGWEYPTLSRILTAAWVEFMHTDNMAPCSARLPFSHIHCGLITHISDCLKTSRDQNLCTEKGQGSGPDQWVFTSIWTLLYLNICSLLTVAGQLESTGSQPPVYRLPE